jgi:hypothetical protein
MVFWTKKQPPKSTSPRQDFRDALDSAVHEAINSHVHLIDLANALDDKAEALRVRHAIDAPL